MGENQKLDQQAVQTMTDQHTPGQGQPPHITEKGVFLDAPQSKDAEQPAIAPSEATIPSDVMSELQAFIDEVKPHEHHVMNQSDAKESIPPIPPTVSAMPTVPSSQWQEKTTVSEGIHPSSVLVDPPSIPTTTSDFSDSSLDQNSEERISQAIASFMRGEEEQEAEGAPNIPSSIFPSTIVVEHIPQGNNDQQDEKIADEIFNRIQAEIENQSNEAQPIQSIAREDQVDVVGASESVHTEVFEHIIDQTPAKPSVVVDDMPEIIIESSAWAQPEPVFVAPDHVTQESESVSVSQTAMPSSSSEEIDQSKAVSAIEKRASRRQKTIKIDSFWAQVVAQKEDDIDMEMLDIFLAEADGQFNSIDNDLASLSDNLQDKKTAHSLKRSMHTLKGSANTTGARKVGAIFHHLEDMMNVSPTVTQELCGNIQAGVDAAFAAIQALRENRSVDEAVGAASAKPTPIQQTSGLETQAIVASTPQEQIMVAVGAVPVRDDSTKLLEDEGAMLKVSSKSLERLVKNVGEINISRSQIGTNVVVGRQAMMGLAVSLEQMYGYLREIEIEAEKQMHAGTDNANENTGFDALQMDRYTRLQELTRRVAEAQNDVMTQQSATVAAIREVEESVAIQRILISDVSADLDRIRQIRVSSIVPNLKRVVRAAARDTGKPAEIYFDADVEIDRGILEKMNGPIEHVLRNAIAHGIESAEERLQANKEPTGSIDFKAYQDGSEVVIEISDDGRGIDIAKVLQKAVNKGIIRPGTRMAEDKIRELLFEPGFSTADAVTDIAGRGVGLDVVRSEISTMGGRVDIRSTLGQGTTFVLRLPSTLTTIAGTAITTGQHMYVTPVSFIDRLVRIQTKDIENAYRSQKLIIKEPSGEQIEYDFWGLWQIIGLPTMQTRATTRGSIILMRGDRIAVHVDEIKPATEFVFRPMGPQIVASSGLIGSTISSTGNASLVIDPAKIVRNLKAIGAKQTGYIDVRNVTPAKEEKTPLVLIVDDSTTVRKITSRLLKREGYRSMEAENGMQALERLQEEKPDVILMDIEMPVMNGYDATKAIRNTPEISDIPIIMITSRAGESHRKIAFELGVNEYLGKPFNDFDLLNAIKKHSSATQTASA